MKRRPIAVGDSWVPFPTTSWTIIEQLQRLPPESPEWRDLIDKWVLRYWKPLYSYFRVKRQSPERAADLAQSVLIYSVLENNKIAQVKNDGRRFRNWLMICARHCLINELRKEGAQKRSPENGIQSFELLKSRSGDPFEPAANDTPEAGMRDAWRRDIVDRALKAVRCKADSAGRMKHFEVFCEYHLSERAGEITWDQVAQLHCVDEDKVTTMADWTKRQLAKALRQEIRSYVDTEDEVDDEIRELLRYFE